LGCRRTSRRDRRKRYAALDEDLTYTANRLDLDVVSTLAVRLDPDTQERRAAEMAKGMTLPRCSGILADGIVQWTRDL
jgi:hypothetical protein